MNEKVIRKKALNKLVAMIKQYKDLRYRIEQSRLDTKPNKLDEIFYEDCQLQTGASKSTKKFILKLYK